MVVATESKGFMKTFLALISLCSFIPSIGMAQEVDRTQVEAAPIPPKPQGGDEPSVRLQSGIGSDVAYARAGVVELGGSVSGTSASKFLSFGIAPSIGWFFADNVELTVIGSWNYAKVEGADANHVGSIVAEPSFVMPLSNTTFVFAGLGIGGLFELNKRTGVAVAPRVGYKAMVGRSGMITFAVQPIFSLNDTDLRGSDETLLTVKNAYNYGIGFTVLL